MRRLLPLPLTLLLLAFLAPSYSTMSTPLSDAEMAALRSLYYSFTDTGTLGPWDFENDYPCTEAPFDGITCSLDPDSIMCV